MIFFNVLFAAFNGAQAPSTRRSADHGTARALIAVLVIILIGINAVEADNILVGKCLKSRCNSKDHTDIYWDDSGKKVGGFPGVVCNLFQSYVTVSLYLTLRDCKQATEIPAGACIAAPAPFYNFQYICPRPSSAVEKQLLDGKKVET